MAQTLAPAPARPRAIDVGIILGASVVANLILFGIGQLLGGAFWIEVGADRMRAGVLEIIAASLLPLTVAIAAFALLATRVAVVRRVWTPVVVVLTLASLGGLTGASDLTTGLTLGTMHLVVGGLAAFAVPRRLER